MATKTSRKKKQESKVVPKKKHSPQSRTRPILGLFLLAMGILSFAALLSYDVNQDSLNNTQPVQDNWVGTVGANFANWVLGVVGIGSWLLPVYFVGFAWAFFFGMKKKLGWLKGSLLVALPFLLCALAGGFGHSVEIKANSYFPSGSLGGNLGSTIFSDFLNPWMGGFGGTVILLLGFCSASLLILTDNPGSLVDSFKASLGGLAKSQKARMQAAKATKAKSQALAAKKALAEQKAAEKAQAKQAAAEKNKKDSVDTDVQATTNEAEPKTVVQQELNLGSAPNSDDEEIMLFGDSPLPGKNVATTVPLKHKHPQKKKSNLSRNRLVRKRSRLRNQKKFPLLLRKISCHKKPRLPLMRMAPQPRSQIQNLLPNQNQRNPRKSFLRLILKVLKSSKARKWRRLRFKYESAMVSTTSLPSIFFLQRPMKTLLMVTTMKNGRQPSSRPSTNSVLK